MLDRPVRIELVPAVPQTTIPTIPFVPKRV